MPIPNDANIAKRLAAEIARISKRLEKSKKTLDGLSTKMLDARYIANVPESIRVQDETRRSQASIELSSLSESLKALIELQQEFQKT